MKRNYHQYILFYLICFCNVSLWTDEISTLSFIKPTNMAGAIKDIKNLTLKHMGTFSGNEREGFFIIGGMTGNYLVSGNLIVFTIHFTGNADNVLLRIFSDTTLFSFTIEKPDNIEKALDAVRVGIEGSGGFFYGNETGGYFNGKGIRGNYIIGEKVIFYISEKPLFLPNSFIEREIRNYFRGD
jgi:hypothetical protein